MLSLDHQVHQTVRWLDHGPLWIEGTSWSGPLLFTPEPPGWHGGPGWPDPADPGRATLPLGTMPVHPVVAPRHPLRHQLQEAWPLDRDPAAAFPSRALPPGAYAQVERSLRSLGLWSSPTRMGRHRQIRWQGRRLEPWARRHPELVLQAPPPGP